MVTGQIVREMHRELMHATFVPSKVEARLLQACLSQPGRAVMIIPPVVIPPDFMKPANPALSTSYMVYQREDGVAS